MSNKISLEPAAAVEAKTKVKAGKAPQETRYTKAALVGSKRFKARRDLLNAILDDGKEYTIAEAEKEFNNYLNKEV